MLQFHSKHGTFNLDFFLKIVGIRTFQNDCVTTLTTKFFGKILIQNTKFPLKTTIYVHKGDGRVV